HTRCSRDWSSDVCSSDLDEKLADTAYTDRQKLALTCRILFDNGHDSGLAGQITARAEQPGCYYTQRLGLGFDEISESNLLVVDRSAERRVGIEGWARGL